MAVPRLMTATSSSGHWGVAAVGAAGAAPPPAHPPSRARSWRSPRRRALLSLLLSLPLALPAWAGSAATRVEVLLVGMNCSLCTQGLERRLLRLPGTDAVLLELERGRLSLTLRPGGSVSDDTLRSVLRDAGFVVRQIRRSSVSLRTTPR